LPVHGHAFVIHHFGQRQHPRHVGKSLRGARVVA
jgi:hypothetical protein